MKNHWLILTCAALAVGACQPKEPEQDSVSGPKLKEPMAMPEPVPVTFASVQQILKANCVVCHSGLDAKEELDLNTFESVMNGSEHGAVVKPGEPDESMIVHALRGERGKDRMPPEPAAALSEADIQTIIDWIEGGAKES